MIVEVILSTVDDDGLVHFAPMGLLWGDSFVEIAPYRSSRTFFNLVAGRGALANVTDDISLFVACALDEEARRDRPHRRASLVPGGIVEGVCSYRELRIVEVSDEGERGRFRCAVVGVGRERDFIGFNRSASALLELAVAATRRKWLTRAVWFPLLERARLMTAKTGGEREREALARLERFFEEG
ncbi:DUF447 family protein [Aminithiophilus ramosus]|uniref:DUF447 family protein n=2 Tax=Synergistales TaxID=649776 RepID=A0A9Q7EY76_9BACT|nr:DUF447 domain-containing protein [Aminithiophilus ramosus]QTX31706.1 DUF447 family protein [Aminithiophilus ramosus]QVL35528.1 DUF447 family protein [Synergistota bacterium]